MMLSGAHSDEQKQHRHHTIEDWDGGTTLTFRILPPDNPPMMCRVCHQPWPCTYWQVRGVA